MASSGLPELVPTADVKDSQFDGVVVVTDSTEKLTGYLECLKAPLEDYGRYDGVYSKGKGVVFVQTDAVPSGRLIYAYTGPLNRDQDDVRRFADAASEGIKRALAAGCKAPLLVRPTDDSFDYADLVAALGSLKALYVPLEIREDVPSKSPKAYKLGLYYSSKDQGDKDVQVLYALESGRIVARDIGGSDPERMAAPRAAEYIEETFEGTCVKVNVISDLATLEKEYPLLVAVNRAAKGVPRHQARLVFLEYEGEGPIDCTLYLVGKGITYDTGGADVKTGGNMAGMHRDKCGAAAVAGFFKILSILKPKGLKVVGGMPYVRNSVGSESYVADEIITSRAGVRVRVVNTDAEGRMVMADVLCKLKEEAAEAASCTNPQLYTIATLTGHVIRAYGEQYTAIMDNGPAEALDNARKVQAAGHAYGEPLEVSTIRREDYEHHDGETEYEDVRQCNDKPSSDTPRGHQSPAAFLIRASGLDKYGKDSYRPLPYTHLDIAGSGGRHPEGPTGAPVVALAAYYILPRLY